MGGTIPRKGFGNGSRLIIHHLSKQHFIFYRNQHRSSITLATVKDKEDFSVLLGPEHLLLEGLSAGVHGGVCGGANLMPRIFVDLFDAFRAEDLDLARTLQVRIVEVGTPLYLTGESQSSYIRGLKASLEVAGICSGKLAWPYLPEEPEEMTHVREHLSHYPETKYSAPNLQPR